jgi:hypothetical protein
METKKEEEIFCCYNCKEESKDPFTHEDDNGNMICDDCYDDEYFVCSHCDEVKRIEDSRERYDGDDICDECYTDTYFTCVNCGEVRHNDDYGQDGLCDSCTNDGDDYDEDRIPERKYHRGDNYCGNSDRPFSTEIECYYPDTSVLRDVADSMNQDFGLSGDGSLNSYGIEFQTPKLSGETGTKELEKFCKLLTEKKFTVDRTCGLHIHLDTSDYMTIDRDMIKIWGRDYATDRAYQEKLNRIKFLMVFYLTFESVILSYLPKSRRKNRYCFPLSEYYHEKEIMDCGFIEDIEKLWYRENNIPRIEDRKKNKYDESRYCGINFHSMLANNHLEIRYHGGTILSNKILNWVTLHKTILDKTFNDDVTYEQLQAIKYLPDLSEKQDAMFSILSLPEKVESYFRSRAKLFTGTSDDLQ